jgi:hypothetical protein
LLIFGSLSEPFFSAQKMSDCTGNTPVSKYKKILTVLPSECQTVNKEM